MSNEPKKRYHTALVVLHWVMSVLVIVALIMGTFQLKTIPNDSLDKIAALKAHMIAGGIILLLTLIRLVVRRSTSHPAPASTGHSLLDRLAPLAHTGLYLLILVMAASGIAISIMAGLPNIVFNNVGALPIDFSAYPPRIVHGIVAKVLIFVILAHIAAALYHQFIRKDKLLSRMGFGPR